MIRRVFLQNWKSHERTELTFSRGTNVLVGQMGAGKSAVLDAISFALFGTFPALKARKIKLDQCIRNRPEQRDSARIEVEFEAGGEQYTVIREITKGKGTALSELRMGGALLEGPSSERVTERVSEILKVGYELFSRAVYSEQNQVDYFLQIPTGQRKRKIDELLGIVRFEEARKSLASVSNRMQGREQEKIGSIAELSKDKALGSLPKIREDCSRLESELAELRNSESIMRSGLESAESGLKSLEAAQGKARALGEEIISLRSKAESASLRALEIEKRLGEDALKKDLGSEVKKLVSEAAEARRKIAALESSKARKDAERLSAELSSARERLRAAKAEDESRKALENRLSELLKENPAKRVADAEARLAQISAEIAKLTLTVSNDELRIKALQGASGKCPVCDSGISEEKHSQLEHGARSSMDSARVRLDALEAEKKGICLPAMRKSLDEYNVVSERLRPMEAKGVVEIETRCGELANGLNAAESRLEAERSEERSLRQELEGLAKLQSNMESLIEKRSEREALMREAENAKARCAGAEGEISKLSVNDALVSKAREDVQSLRIRMGEARTKSEMGARMLGDKKALLTELEEKMERLEAAKKELDSLSGGVSSLSIFGSALLATQESMREEFTAEVNYAMAEIWPMIYPYGDYSSVRMGVESGDYTLQAMSRSGEWMSVEGIASGGERSTACLALRMAFSLVLAQNVSWLVLDEPTHNLDSNGVEMLSKSMRESLPQLVDQIFVITHDSGMESAVSGKLYRMEREKGEDGPTKAESVGDG